MARGRWLEGMSFHFFKFSGEVLGDVTYSNEERLIVSEHNEKIEKLILEMQDVLNRTDVRYTVSKFKWRTRIYIPKNLINKVDRDLFDKLLRIEAKQKGIMKESCKRLKGLKKGE